MAEEVTLLDFWASPYAMRVRIALAEKGIKYESKEQDLMNKSELLLKLNPVHKRVPVLIHNGNSVCESLILVQYIDEICPNKSPLLPLHPHQRATARFWADFVDNKVYDLGRKVLITKGEEHEATKKEFIESLKLLEGELEEKPYFGGDHLGYVDVVMVPIYSWFYAYEKCGYFNIETECPKLVEWAKRCMEKESVSKSLPDQEKVYDYVLHLKRLHLIQ